jgi:hypothetical protein
MRPSLYRSPWPVLSMLGAALALLTVSLAGAATVEGGRLVRTGRSAQRLEAADGIPHSHEQDEPDSSLAGLVVGRAVRATAPRAAHAVPPGQTWSGRTAPHGSTSQLVWPIHTPALAGAPPGPSTRLTHADVNPLSARTIRPALGRAPPTA